MPLPPPPDYLAPPLPRTEPLPEKSVQAERCDVEPTHVSSKTDKETWRQRIKLLSTAISAYETSVNMRIEVTKLKKTVMSEQFKSHPVAIQNTIVRRLEQATTKAEVSSTAFEKVLEQLQNSDLWLTLPSKPSESSAKDSPGVTLLAREVVLLSTQVAEIKTSIQQLESAPSGTSHHSGNQSPQTQGFTQKSKNPHGNPGSLAESRAKSVEDGEIASPPGDEDVVMIEEGERYVSSTSQSVGTDDQFRGRIEELEKRLESIHDMLYQERDDYMENVDAHVAAKLASLTVDDMPADTRRKADMVEAGMALLQEKMRDYEAVVLSASKRQELLEAENAWLQAENKLLRGQLSMAERQLPDMQDIQRELRELQETFAAYGQIAPLTSMPSREDVVDAILPIIRESIHADTAQILEAERENAAETLQRNEDRLVSAIMPRVNLTTKTTEEMKTWLTSWAKTAKTGGS